MKIDLTSKKSEADWIKSVDKFWLTFTPHFFELIEWLIVIGLIKYLSEKYDLLILKVILGISYLFLTFYVSSGLYSTKFLIRKMKSPRLELLISLLISTLFIYIYIKVSSQLIEVISLSNKT